jgi:arylsulfatase A-like enzyme
LSPNNLTPLVRDEPVGWREDWYYEHVYNTKPPRRPIVKCEGVRTDRWKYIRYPKIEPPYEQLFDLGNDPREERNLAGNPDRAEQLTRLRARCDEYRQSLE